MVQLTTFLPCRQVELPPDIHPLPEDIHAYVRSPADLFPAPFLLADPPLLDRAVRLPPLARSPRPLDPSRSPRHAPTGAHAARRPPRELRRVQGARAQGPPEPGRAGVRRGRRGARAREARDGPAAGVSGPGAESGTGGEPPGRVGRRRAAGGTGCGGGCGCGGQRAGRAEGQLAGRDGRGDDRQDAEGPDDGHVCGVGPARLDAGRRCYGREDGVDVGRGRRRPDLRRLCAGHCISLIFVLVPCIPTHPFRASMSRERRVIPS